MAALCFASSLYGATRANQDFDDRQMRQREADTLDAQRQFELEQSRIAAPKKQRALDIELAGKERDEAIAVENEPAKRKLFSTQLKLEQFKTEDQQEVMETMRNARNAGFKMMGAIQSKDPNALAQASMSAFPGVKVTNARGRMEGDSIIIEAEDDSGKTITRRIDPTRVKETGEVVSAWDVANMQLVNGAMNPVKYAEKMMEHRFKLTEESAKQKAIGESHERVARINAAGRESRLSDQDEYRERTVLRQTLGTRLKAPSELNGLITGFTNTEDRELYLAAQRRGLNNIRRGMYAEEAADEAWNGIKRDYDRATAGAQKIADEITTAAEKDKTVGFDFRDEAQLEKAAAAGNKQAIRLKEVFEETRKALGYGVARHMQKNLKIIKPKT
jgi:hypothetical protein